MNVWLRRTAQLLSLSLGVLLLCIPAFSQLNLGRISGSVTDESGGSMANAKVTVTDQDRGVSRALTSDEAGAFSAPSLTPGNYTVRVEAAGFNISERKDVIVQVGGEARVDMVMKAGSQTQTITVAESVPLINTTAATLGGVMEGSEVTELPFIGRSYQSLLQFTPGVVTRPGGGSNGHSSNGLRSDGNNWLFEGIFSGGVRTAGSIVNTNSNTGDGASVVPPDAIQEFNIGFQNKAEYGWKPGVASNVGIKSGTNSIHGTFFAVGQTSILNARNPFTLPTNPKPDLGYEQYGATVGGPIKKDKVFYYVAFEGMQFTQGTPTNHPGPTTAMIAGDATNSIPAAYLDIKSKAPAGTLPGSLLAFNPAAVDANGNVNPALLSPSQQLSAKLVGLNLFPNGLAPGNVFSYAFTSSRSPNKNLIGKIDWHPSDKNQITGEYFIARDNEYGNTQAVTQPYWGTYYFLTGNVARASWTYVPNSTWVNEAHFGFDRKVENSWPGECSGNGPAAPDYSGINSGAATPCLGSATPTAFSLPVITISGFDALSAGTTQQRRVEGYWSIVDNVSYSKGNHNVKMGVELRRPYLSGASYAGERGSVSFGTSSINAFTNATPLESFLLGVPSTGSLLFGDPTVVMRNYDFGSFVQDDWRITPRLTLNMGLRYEYETAITEDNNKLAQFNPTLGMTQLGANGFNSLWNSQKLGWNLQPRLGAIYDVTGKGTTVVRAAYGIYSSWPVWQVPLTVAALGNNPTAAALYNVNGGFTPPTGTIGAANVTFATSGGTGGAVAVPSLTWTTAGPIFPTGSLKCGNGLPPVAPVVAGAAATNPGTCGVGEMDQNWKLPYVREWTVGIQHAISSNISLDVAYVGNHGTRLLGATDANEPTLGTNAKAREQQSRPFYNQFPWMAKLTDVQNLSYSNYNALQATLSQRSWHGLTSTVGYTFSHTLDSTQTDITQNVYPLGTCPNCNYGPTGFDVRHRMTLRATYLIPGKKGYAQVLQGWQLSSLVNLLGALPYNMSDTSSDFSGTAESNERWSMAGNASDFSSYGRFVAIPCFGVAGSSFAKSGACTTVATLAAMPQACQTAAAALPTNPAVVAAADKNATGSLALTNFGCYMAGNSVIVPPAQGTVGNIGSNVFRGAGLRLWDVSVRKHTKLGERVDAEFQFDMYNFTNTPQFSGVGVSPVNPATFGQASATPNVNNGNVVQGTGDARRYQFGLHFTF